MGRRGLAARRSVGLVLVPAARWRRSWSSFQVGLGLWLLISGNQPEDELHYLYGVSILVVTMVSEGMRIGAAQRELDEVDDCDALSKAEQAALARRVVLREMGVMTIGALLDPTLALRAGASAGGFGV